MHNRFAFQGQDRGTWAVRSLAAVRGEGVAPASHVAVLPYAEAGGAPAWRFDGLMSNLRYATRQEVSQLRARQQGLGRPGANYAAMIPIKKSDAWWALAQDERRAIFEETSRHTEIGLAYLPAIARQLYHCRDLAEPFDFVTWFEFAPVDEPAFEDLLARLRATPEWHYVAREVDIRLVRGH